MANDKIRNFCIIAHIDHGKSTLADRFLEITETIPESKMVPQFLDRLEAEREHGITVKMQPVQMKWKNHILNLIDTPGHIDFSYEVSRALKVVEGAILLVDATSGVEAQTLSVLEMAKFLSLKIIPVINKIDLPQARVKEVASEIASLLGVDEESISLISAKTGKGVKELLDRIIKEIPPPRSFNSDCLKALVFDANYDLHRGVIAYIRIFEGVLSGGKDIFLVGTKTKSSFSEVGIFSPDFVPKEELCEGEIGYIITDLKDINKVLIGDTLTYWSPTLLPNFKVIEGFKKPQPKVFASFYPCDENEFQKLKKSIEFLSLTDSSFIFRAEFSPLLGRGFKVGALGSLHLKILQERLEREFQISTIVTPPKVAYKFVLNDGSEIISERLDGVDFSKVKAIYEEKAILKIIVPLAYQGKIADFLSKKAKFLNTEFLVNSKRVILEYEVSFLEVVRGLYEKILSLSSGFASMSYKLGDFKKEDLVKIDIYIGSKLFSPLSFLTLKNNAYREAKIKVEKIKKLFPRQLFEVDIKAQIGSKVIAKERIPPLRKDVLAKLYGGDRTRKDKLLEKQKKGKKKLKQIGNFSLPSDLFFKLGQEL